MSVVVGLLGLWVTCQRGLTIKALIKKQPKNNMAMPH